MRKRTTQPKKASGALVPLTIHVRPEVKAGLKQLAEQADMSLSKAVAFILRAYLLEHQRFAGTFEQKADQVFQQEFARVEEACIRGIAEMTSFFGNRPKKVFKGKEIN